MTVPRECPRCGNLYLGFPALSRRFPIDICPECGVEEAFRDATGTEPMDPREWFRDPRGIVLTSGEIVLTSEEEAVQ